MIGGSARLSATGCCRIERCRSFIAPTRRSEKLDAHKDPYVIPELGEAARDIVKLWVDDMTAVGVDAGLCCRISPYRSEPPVIHSLSTAFFELKNPVQQCCQLTAV